MQLLLVFARFSHLLWHTLYRVHVLPLLLLLYPSFTTANTTAAYCRIQTFLMDLSPGFYEPLPSDLKTTTTVAPSNKITKSWFLNQKSVFPNKWKSLVNKIRKQCLFLRNKHRKYRISFYCFWSMKTGHFEHLPLFNLRKKGAFFGLWLQLACSTNQQPQHNIWTHMCKICGCPLGSFHFSFFLLPSSLQDFEMVRNKMHPYCRKYWFDPNFIVFWSSVKSNCFFSPFALLHWTFKLTFMTLRFVDHI